jgi:hypothetical protein
MNARDDMDDVMLPLILSKGDNNKQSSSSNHHNNNSLKQLQQEFRDSFVNH